MQTKNEGKQTGGLFDDAEVISRYTRADAIADGVIIEVIEPAPFPCAVGLTRAVWDHYVQVPPGVVGQDETGRLWDILWMAHCTGRRANEPEYLFRLHVRNDNRGGTPPLVTLKAVVGGDDDGAPCVTVMLPDED